MRVAEGRKSEEVVLRRGGRARRRTRAYQSDSEQRHDAAGALVMDDRANKLDKIKDLDGVAAFDWNGGVRKLREARAYEGRADEGRQNDTKQQL